MPISFDHTRIRVSDLQKSIDWYSRTCGFEVLKRTDKSPSGNQLAHLAIPGSSHKLELTYSPDFKVEFPEDLVHTCIRVDSIMDHCQMLEDAGIEVWPEAWKDKFTQPEANKMAFITDPDGYEVEILEH